MPEVRPLPGQQDFIIIACLKAMTQEKRLLIPNLGINCQGETVPDFEDRHLLIGIGLAAEENRLSLLPGERFTLDREVLLGFGDGLGFGASSRIIPGFDRQLNQAVAIKVMRAAAAFRGGEEIENFAQEARLMMMLDHPNIVTVYGLTLINVFDEPTPGIVMEKAEGSLWDEDRFPPKKVGEAVLNVAGALDYLQENGVVHMDVCPGNILRNKRKFLLSDFSVALDWRGRLGLSFRDEFSAPELFALGKKKRRIFPRDVLQADQHALAATAFMLLTNFNEPGLWVDESGEDVGRHADKGVILNPETALSPEVYRVLRKATSYDPSRRYASCVEFGLGLNEVIGG